MISKYSHKGLNWIDLESPSKEEVGHVIEQLGIPLSVQEKLNITTKEDIIHIDDNVTIINIANKIIFVVCDKYVLSIHPYKIDAFDKFSKELELDIIIDEKSKIINHKLLFAYLLKNLYVSSEKEIFANKNEIINIKKQLANKTKRLKLFVILSIILLGTTIILLCL